MNTKNAIFIRTIYWLNRLGPLLGLVVIYAAFAIWGPEGFASIRNLETIARQTTVVGIAALGMTMIIILGGIDLSVGSTIALSTVVIALALGKWGMNPVLAALMGVAAGAACGAFNGLVITKIKVVPFVVTLGTLLGVRGIAKGLANEQKVDAPITWLNNLLATLSPDQKWMIVPAGVWLLIILAFVMAIVLRYTKLGKHTFAIGSNEQTAGLCGVPIDRVKISVYALAGAFAGLAGLMQFSRLTVGDPTAAQGLELDVIAAVVIGGGSLSGGEGSIFGSIVGALIMTVIRFACAQMGLPNWVQEIVTGAIIVAAVALDKFRQRKG